MTLTEIKSNTFIKYFSKLHLKFSFAWVEEVTTTETNSTKIQANETFEKGNP